VLPLMFSSLDICLIHNLSKPLYVQALLAITIQSPIQTLALHVDLLHYQLGISYCLYNLYPHFKHTIELRIVVLAESVHSIQQDQQLLDSARVLRLNEDKSRDSEDLDDQVS
jgi:hypothetical protein